MKTPLSSYDILYKSMSPEDHEKIEKDVSSIIAKSMAESNDVLKKEVEKAVSELYSRTICCPFGSVIEENSGSYQFIEALQSQIWKLLLNTPPGGVSKYALADLIKSWREKFPEEFKTVVGAELAEENKKLNDKLDFEIRLNRRNY